MKIVNLNKQSKTQTSIPRCDAELIYLIANRDKFEK